MESEQLAPFASMRDSRLSNPSYNAKYNQEQEIENVGNFIKKYLDSDDLDVSTKDSIEECLKRTKKSLDFIEPVISMNIEDLDAVIESSIIFKRPLCQLKKRLKIFHADVRIGDARARQLEAKLAEFFKNQEEQRLASKMPEQERSWQDETTEVLGEALKKKRRPIDDMENQQNGNTASLLGRNDKDCEDLKNLIGDIMLGPIRCIASADKFKTNDAMLKFFESFIDSSFDNWLTGYKTFNKIFLKDAKDAYFHFEVLKQESQDDSAIKLFQGLQNILDDKMLKVVEVGPGNDQQESSKQLKVFEQKVIENLEPYKILKKESDTVKSKIEHNQRYLRNVTLGCMGVTTGCLAGYVWAPTETAAQWSGWLGSRMVGASLIALAAYLKAPKNLPAHKAVEEAQENAKKESSRWTGIFNKEFLKKCVWSGGLFGVTFATLYKSDLIAEKLDSLGFGSISLSGMSAMGKQQLSALLSGIRTRFSTPTA